MSAASRAPLILATNDDGYDAPGLRALIEAVEPLGELVVAAPDREKSGASHALTLERPLRVMQVGAQRYRIDGTPTDCVHLAITGLLEEEPDMVVSGINAGANMGDDVLYSGTVAAAMEGRFLGLPAIAVSMTSYEPQHYATGVRAIVSLIDRLSEEPLEQAGILNVCLLYTSDAADE